MLFHTPQFFLFLASTIGLFYAAPKALRKYILLSASYFFYGCWNYKFIALLIVLTAIDYTAGCWLERIPPGRRRKLVLISSLGANLGFLGFFKYFNFLEANLALAAGRSGALRLDVVLPLGISFHTFQSLSYVIDVYRGEQKAVRNPIDYALYICFFPQLVAGPIVRARDFFRDLWKWQRPSGADVSQGLMTLLLGLTKKMAFADQFAKVANGYFANVPGNAGMLTAWSGVIAFGLQIYFDFSGYTDMAIGMAKLLGFHFPINFRRPYLARTVTEFWRRWHISLSTWLRDYLYIPLGGNRGSRWRTYRNLMITMLLGGLWHGASWNFVVWGGYQGVLLSAEKALGIRRGYSFTVLTTFALEMIGWVFFRAANLEQSIAVLRQMFGSSLGRNLFTPWQIGLALIALGVSVAEEKLEWFERIARRPALAYASAICGMLFLIEIFGVLDQAIPFIYFQF